MNPQVKIALAMLLLVGGAVGAFIFRKPVDRSVEAPLVADRGARTDLPEPPPSGPEPAPHLVGRIDALEATETAPGAGPWHSNYSSGAAAGNYTAADTMPGSEDMPTAAPWRQPERANLPSHRVSARTDDPETNRNRPVPRTHRIIDGDTLSGLATRYLGRADRFGEIYEANRDVLRSPDVLPLGALLKIPSAEEPPPIQIGPMVPITREPAPPLAPLPTAGASNDNPAPLGSLATQATGATSRIYRVQDGDTLTAIARKFFGDAQKHTAILAANRDQLPDAASLRSGMVLIIPE
ncbi:MAG: LysM peptidoglycan-binding domain-containing protein [Pirellulales bacterium]